MEVREYFQKQAEESEKNPVKKNPMCVEVDGVQVFSADFNFEQMHSLNTGIYTAKRIAAISLVIAAVSLIIAIYAVMLH